MLLRASGERENADYDLGAITDDKRDPGVVDAHWLRALTEFTISRDWDKVADTLPEAASRMGYQQAVDALVVASAFNGITRVADATGIPLDASTADNTVDMRAMVGLDAFDYQQKTARFG